MVTINTRPPADRITTTLSFYKRDRWSSEIGGIARAKMTKNDYTESGVGKEDLEHIETPVSIFEPKGFDRIADADLHN